MNFKNKIIDYVQANKFMSISGERISPDMLVDGIKSAVAFYINDYEDLPDIKHSYIDCGSEINMPYRNVFLDIGNMKGVNNFSIHAQMLNDVISFDSYILHKQHDVCVHTAHVTIDCVTTNWKYQLNPSYDTNKEDDRRVVAALAYIPVLDLISVLECNNVYVHTNHPPEKLNKKRIKKGKLPLFEYKTLHIKTPNENTCNITGNASDRAGPRVHLRRGHIRHCASGIKTWVQPCVVGNRENGMIVKDYSL